MTSRNALDFVVNLPGVNTPAGSRDSTVNGLPQRAINITLDGMNIQDNYLKTTDGFFARLSPRLDAVEEVTVTAAANGADCAGQGAVQHQLHHAVGHQRPTRQHLFVPAARRAQRQQLVQQPRPHAGRRDGKAPKTELRQYQPGTRFGGPIGIPGLYNGRNKAFFFVNYEDSPRAEQHHADADDPVAEGAAGHLPLHHRGRRHRRGQPAGSSPAAAVRPPRSIRQVGKLLSDIRASTDDGAVTDLSDPIAAAVRRSRAPVDNFTPPDGAARLQPVGQATG